jgi:Integrase zinc binding domain
MAGHPGASNTWIAVAWDYWWPDLKKYIASYIKGCAVCQSTKPNMVWPRVPLFPIMSKEDTQSLPFQMVTWDLVMDLSQSGEYDSVLTIMDHSCSKAALFFPCAKKIDTEGVVTLYTTKVFPHYSVPQKIISDRDLRFTADFMCTICMQLSICQNISTAYHPQMDGQLERANVHIEQYLCIYRNMEQDDWVHLLLLTQYVHNS